uniref:Uncharacterized protein n=1 Tax=Pleurostichidium falkenbergii TaxID=121064 RepID=A0A4D6UYP2_9FLOR|nr:hypothetical protein [Pleurostichidium falkenbergii]QCH39640.1 hypothetical protein [Pleurostichidium falkenbergii]
MKINLNLLFKNIRGDWFLQEHFYFSSNKKQKKKKKKLIFFFENFKKNEGNILYELTKEASKQNRKIIISSQYYLNYNKRLLFKLKQVKSNLFIVTKLNKQKMVYSKEYIHIINTNIIIAITVIKNLEKNRYLALKVCSYIKLLNK